MPKSADAKQFAFIITDEDRRMLQELADADQRAAGDWLRVLIRREYADRFGRPAKSKKK